MQTEFLGQSNRVSASDGACGKKWRAQLCGRIASVAIILSITGMASAEEQVNSGAGTNAPDAPADDASDIGFNAGSVIVVPIPVNDPTFGTGLVVGGGYLFTADEGSDTSFLGGGVFGTDEGSRAIGIGGGLSLYDNKYNVSLVFGLADINYDLFILGRPVEIEQEGGAFQGEFRYGFTTNFSAGVSVRYLESKIAGVGGVDLPDEIVDLTDVSIATAGLVAKWDARDDTFYPTAGNSVDFSLTYSEESGGLNLEYTSLRVGYNQFWSLNDRSVIGARVAGCAIEDKAPFFDSCLLGGELRGFSLFEDYGRSMLTAQAEYRRRLSDRFGVVAFVGAGDVQSNFTSLDSGMRYAGEVGLRYRVSKEFGLDVALDATINDDSTNYIYFYVGQHF